MKNERTITNCIMPEMPYCPNCKYGYIAYKDEDYGGIETPTECEWICTYSGKEVVKNE